MFRRIVFAAVLVPGVVVAQADLPTLLQRHSAAPTDWKVCFELGNFYVGVQKLEDALGFYSKAAKLNPSFVPARKNRATVLWFLNRKKEAAHEFTLLLPLSPKDPVPHLYLGLAAHDGKRWVSAKQHFAAAGDLALSNPEVLPAVLNTYLKADDQSLNSHVLSLLPEQSLPAVTKLKLGAIFEANGQSEAAYKAFSAAIASDATLDQAYIALANLSALHQNNAHALDVIARGLQQAPDSSGLLFEQGLLFALEGKPVEAETSFRQARELKPDWAAPVLASGVLQLEAGRFGEAKQTFRTAASAAPQDYRCVYLYATALLRSGAPEDRPQAMSELEKAIRLAPREPKPRVLLAQALLTDGKNQEAVGQLEKAVSIDRNHAPAVYQLSLAYRRIGKALAARNMVARFQALKHQEKEEQNTLVEVLRILKEK
jgi:tetratricopeptide (TPR) repeat protein